MQSSHSQYALFKDLMRKNNFADAATLAKQQSIAQNNNNTFWLTQYAIALIKMKHFEMAAKAAQRALKLSPNNKYALLAYADALRGIGKNKEALDSYKEVLYVHRYCKQAIFGVLSCLGQMQSWDTILQQLQRWPIAPQLKFSWQVKALRGLGKTSEALECCREWLRLYPDTPEALWQQTELEIELEGVTSVLERMERIAKISSRPPVYREIYASLCRRTGNTNVALEQYEKLSSTSASNHALRKQAFIFAKTGNEQKAINLIEELLRFSPHDIYFHSCYIAACRRIGALRRAEKYYNELINRYPNEKKLYGRLIRIQKELSPNNLIK